MFYFQLKYKMILENIEMLKFRFCVESSRRSTLGIQWNAVVSHPAAIIIHTHVAHHLLGGALRGSRGVAGRRTDGVSGHAEVSEPAAIMCSHVTTDVSLATLRGKRRIADSGTDGSLRHTDVSQPAVSVCSHVTADVTFSTL